MGSHNAVNGVHTDLILSNPALKCRANEGNMNKNLMTIEDKFLVQDYNLIEIDRFGLGVINAQ